MKDLPFVGRFFRRLRRRRRRGTALYVSVLSTTLIVSLLGLAGLTIVRIERKQMATSTELLDARANGASAVELALHVIANDPNWRTSFASGVETTPQSLGPGATGTISWILEDSDGSLMDADTKLRLKGIGRVGKTVQVSSVDLVPESTPSPEQLFLDENKPGSGSNYTLESGKGVGTNFTPTLPAGAISWKITRVEVWCSSFQSGTFDAQVTSQDGWGTPLAVLDSVTVSSDTLPKKDAWHEIQFANAEKLMPGEGACVVFLHRSGGKVARIKRGTGSTASPGTQLLGTTNGGSSWTTYLDQDLWIKVWGTYATSSGVSAQSGTWLWDGAP